MQPERPDPYLYRRKTAKYGWIVSLLAEDPNRPVRVHGETGPAACARLRSALGHYTATMMYRWSVRSIDGGVIVRSIGKF
jgi:hypothetical protein